MNVLLDIFRQTCFCHHFELHVAELHRQGKIKLPIYVSAGSEHIASSTFHATGLDWAIFPQHRCHSYGICWGIDPAALIRELMGRPDGCNGGYGGSASISIPGKMFFHDGLLGSNLPIAIGFAHGTNRPTIVHIGDSGIEEDYALASLGYAASKKCPVLVIVEDNDRSILTPKSVRRPSWDIVPVAKAFGVEAIEIEDDPLLIYNTVMEYKQKLPALINIKCCRHLYHAGSGSDGEPEWDRYEMFKKSIPNADQIEKEIKNKIDKLCIS